MVVESCRRNNASSTAQEGMWCGRWRQAGGKSVQTRATSEQMKRPTTMSTVPEITELNLPRERDT